MAKNSVNDYDTTAGNNTDIQSVNIAEGCAPSNINNAIRELMADLAGAFQGGVTATAINVAALNAQTATVTALSIGTYTAVSAARQVTAGLGLSGGGALSSDVTLALDVSDLTATATVVSSADYVPIFRTAATATHKVLLSDAWPAMPNIQKFDTAGTATYTPSAGVRYVYVEVTGGGGGGGGADNDAAGGAGGGAGGTAVGWIDSPTATLVTVGAGGTAGSSSGGNGGSGGNSSFGAAVAASGGAGGSGVTGAGGSTKGGSGGNGTAGDVLFPGGEGGPGLGSGSIGALVGGCGGASKHGGGGSGSQTLVPSVGADGSAWGSGGGGGGSNSSTGRAGGAGKNGIVIVTEYF